MDQWFLPSLEDDIEIYWNKSRNIIYEIDDNDYYRLTL